MGKPVIETSYYFLLSFVLIVCQALSQKNGCRFSAAIISDFNTGRAPTMIVYNCYVFSRQLAQRATIADLSPMCQVQSAPKLYATFPPTPVMLHIKFDQDDWPNGFRDIQVQKCEIFVTQGQVTPK